ncbi:MAG TPA: hypothetical protein VGZ00_01425 [Candidatus Baltobacteraceae bacterium]|jgi:N-dimethylarginine dimethylaminohydrolase|nr:hypothetical protein [Candidatus Baltobacteraceae bacterium]
MNVRTAKAGHAHLEIRGTVNVRIDPKTSTVGDGGRLQWTLAVAPTASIATLEPIFGESHAIADRAIQQHLVFLQRLHATGVTTEVLSEPPSVMAFTVADLAILVRGGAILMRPTDLARRAELKAVEAALARTEIPILGRIEAPGVLDGGDVLYADGVLYIATPREDRALTGVPHSPHGNVAGRMQLARIAEANGLRSVEVALSAQIRRLRGVASFLEKSTVLVAPSVVDCSVFEGCRLIEVERGEEYGAGVLALGRRRVLANVRFRKVLPRLRSAGYTVDAIDLWEFGKLGITPSLLAIA